MSSSYVRRSTILFFLVSIALSTPPDPSGAAPNRGSEPAFTITWWTVDGGGSSWIGAAEDYRTAGTIGQPDARRVSDQSWGLQGGFWAEDPHGIFNDGFESGDSSAWSSAVGLTTSLAESLERE